MPQKRLLEGPLMTLFIFLNHALNEAQISEAKVRFGVSEFVNLSEIANKKWSEIPPEIDSLNEYLSEFKEALKSRAKKGDLVLIQGDFGASFLMINFALNLKLTPIYATTKREVVSENGVIKKAFKHEKFRLYEVSL